MKCRHCGADIPEGMMICPDCRTEVQMVPDYNPLEDVLTREVKGSVEDATRPIRPDDLRQARQRTGMDSKKIANSTRVLSQEELDEIRAKRRRQHKLEKRRKAKRKRRNLLLVLFIILLLIAGAAYLISRNSYGGLVRRGNQAAGAGDYNTAQKFYNRAVEKDDRRPEAYTGLAKVLLAQEDESGAENVLLGAIDAQPENASLYKAAITFYEDTKQLDKISPLLDGCDESVLKSVKEYVSEAPSFQPDEGTYSEVQEVTLTGKGTIYYTTDGSEPTTKSTLYKEPVLLSEGTTVVKAIAVNKKGIPSLSNSRTYTIDIPIADAPAVSPSTGQYTSAQKITIDVPEGYTAYYTTDGSEPTEASAVYTEPVDMPEGQTIFSAILVSKNGKTTPVTKRNYILSLN